MHNIFKKVKNHPTIDSGNTNLRIQICSKKAGSYLKSVYIYMEGNIFYMAATYSVLYGRHRRRIKTETKANCRRCLMGENCHPHRLY